MIAVVHVEVGPVCVTGYQDPEDDLDCPSKDQ